MKTTKPTVEDAKRLYDAIQKNVDAMYADEITYDEFGIRQAALWREIEADAETYRRVLSLMRTPS